MFLFNNDIHNIITEKDETDLRQEQKFGIDVNAMAMLCVYIVKYLCNFGTRSERACTCTRGVQG